MTPLTATPRAIVPEIAPELGLSQVELPKLETIDDPFDDEFRPLILFQIGEVEVPSLICKQDNVEL